MTGVQTCALPISRRRIGKIKDAGLRRTNRSLLKECDFSSIQTAIDEVSQQGTTIYLLPGVYRERAGRGKPKCAEGLPEDDPKEPGAPILTYEQQLTCPHAQNLIGIFGDIHPEDDERKCDAPVCDLQLEGTGANARDVVITGGFTKKGYFAKLNGIRADRADGVYFKNFTIQLFEFNALYVLETDGFVIDDVIGRWNDEYGFLTFAVDHGLYKNCEGYGNGDSAVYPGSASDVNSESTETGELKRWSVEITGCKSHHNTLGYSGTAGNSVYAHDNRFYKNATGMVTDSFFPNHPGLPQDHSWFTRNKIYSNNVNYYEKYLHSGICDKKPAKRGYKTGTVCPAIPTPVGTGIVIAGGNYNYVEGNDLWDNWRQALMLFGVPGAFREETNPDGQFDTSHYNFFMNNRFGYGPGDEPKINGMDVWWDEQGSGNCWQENVDIQGEVTHNATAHGGLPDCDSGGSLGFPATEKQGGLAPCATYDRYDEQFRDPPGCTWFDSPEKPQP